MGKKAQAVQVKVAERPVVYPEYETSLCIGDHEFTASQAKEFLGATEDATVAAQYECKEPLFKDRRRKPVYCVNNLTNRPLYMNVVETLVQQILRKRWRFNMEPFIIGKTALVLNGQHTMVALYLAEQDRLLDAEKSKKWVEDWPDEVRIAKIINYGADEDDEVVNTMDTCKPRSLADVIYRSVYFRKVKAGERKTLAKMCDHAIRFLWSRTGQGVEAFAPKQTHAEFLAFLEKHPRLERCVKHVWEEYQGGKEDPKKWERNNKRFGAGYAAGLLYLMGSAATDGDAYHNARRLGEASEEMLDFDTYWDKACEFWTLFADNSSDFKHLFGNIAALYNPDTLTGGSMEERTGIIVKGWLAYAGGDKLTEKNTQLHYEKNEDGEWELVENPSCGGIDLGKVKKEKPEKKGKEEEELTTEQRMAQEKERKVKEMQQRQKDSRRKGPKKKEGDVPAAEPEKEKVETNGKTPPKPRAKVKS